MIMRKMAKIITSLFLCSMLGQICYSNISYADNVIDNGYIVYVDGESGNNANTGIDKDHAVKSLEKAYEIVLANSEIKTDKSKSATIVVCGAVEINNNHFNYEGQYEHQGTLKITSKLNDNKFTNGVLKIGAPPAGTAEIRFQLGGPTIFDNIIIQRTASQSLTFYAARSLVMGEGVVTKNNTGTDSWIELTPEQASSIKLSAHRGYQPYAPENSCPAFEKAGQMGYWAIETDVQMTKDGHLICMHDGSLDRTTNGTGLVSEKNLNEIREYVIDTAGYGAIISNFDSKQLKIPDFSEYLNICKQYGCLPFIELKCNGMQGEERDEFINKVIQESVDAGFDEDEIIISSGSYSDLEATRKLNKNVFLHSIWCATVEQMRSLKTEGKNNVGVSFNITNLTDETNYNNAQAKVTEAHSSGVEICLRGGDSLSEVSKMIQLGLDYIPTNLMTPSGLVKGEIPYSYNDSYGKIFIRGGYRYKNSTEDVNLVILSGNYDFVAASNAEKSISGKYSVEVGGDAYINRLVVGPTCNSTASITDSSVTIRDSSKINNLYIAGDYGNVNNVNVDIDGGVISAINSRRSGKSGQANKLNVIISDNNIKLNNVSLSDDIITGNKILCFNNMACKYSINDIWDKYISDGSEIIIDNFDDIAIEDIILDTKNNGKFIIENNVSFTNSPNTIMCDGNPVSAGTEDADFTYISTVEDAQITALWYKDNNGVVGDKMTNPPYKTGTYWIGIKGVETPTNTAGLYIAETEETRLRFTIINDNSETLNYHKVSISSGIGEGSYKSGETVTVKADNPINGMVFDRWIIVSGEVVLEDPTSETTTFIMPKYNVEIKATYKKDNTLPPFAALNLINRKFGNAEDGDAYIYGNMNWAGWRYISRYIGSRRNNAVIRIDMNEQKELPQNIINSIKGTNKTIIVYTQDGTTYKIKGKDVN